jgi:hypothetical protein
MATQTAALSVDSTLEPSGFRIPAGYERGIRFGANWTMAISPYLILYFILVIAIGPADDASPASTLAFAGSSQLAFQAVVFLDGLFHVLIFGTIITLFAALRETYPVQANLILVCGTWQILMGFTKGMIASIVMPRLGAEYLAADAALRAAFLPAAIAMDSLHTALQWMDSLGVVCVWILVSLLPKSTGLPRAVRWLGWIMAFGILVPESLFPGFLLVILLSGPWLFFLGRWMKRLTVVPQVAEQGTTGIIP